MKLKKIVVPLDGSKVAEESLEPAARLAEAYGGELLLVRVCDLPLAGVGDGGLTYLNLLETLQSEAEHYLEKVSSSLGTDCPVQTDVLTGHPVDTLLKKIEEFEADMVVMTSHGRSGLERWLLGSVAENFARRSTCPVLVLRAGKKLEWPLGRKVLVPLDGSKLAEGVLPLAEEMARKAEGELILLRSYSLAESPSFEYASHDIYPPGADVPSRKAGPEIAAEYLHTTAEQCSVRSSSRVSTDYAPEAILATAEEEGADLIALTSHGATGLAKWVFGSVADKVLRHSDRPVLLFRSDWSRTS